MKTSTQFHSVTFIGLSFGFSVWQCEHNIKTINIKVMYFRSLCLKITCMWKDYLFQTITSWSQTRLNLLRGRCSHYVHKMLVAKHFHCRQNWPKRPHKTSRETILNPKTRTYQVCDCFRDGCGVLWKDWYRHTARTLHCPVDTAEAVVSVAFSSSCWSNRFVPATPSRWHRSDRSSDGKIFLALDYCAVSASLNEEEIQRIEKKKLVT